MKKFFSVLILFVFAIPCFAKTIEGGITYTVESARKEAFDGVLYQIPVESFSGFLVDPDFLMNKNLMNKGIKDTKDRKIEKFSDGYIITYFSDRYKAYSYNLAGELEEIQIFTSLNCPMKSRAYNTNGILVSVDFYVTWNDIYVYSPSGTLNSHWVGNTEYNANGKVINHRLKN